MCNLKKWEEQLKAMYKAYSHVCEDGDVEYEQEGPATQEEIDELEAKLGMSVPESLKATFLGLSKNIYFSADLPDDFKLPPQLREIFCACFTISLEEMVEAEECRKAWIEACLDEEENEYDKVWCDKLGFMTVATGDVIAFDLSDPKEDKRVIYLSHDDGEGHGVILGQTFADYFENLLLIGGCGNEDWQMIPFVKEGKGLDADSVNADIYRKLIGLK